MKLKRIAIAIISSMTWCIPLLFSQSDVQLSHHFKSLGYYNPAHVGRTDQLNITALYRIQWLGMSKNVPQSIFVSAEMPWYISKRKHGVGVVIRNDAAGLFKDLYTSAQYSFQKKIGKGTLNIGVQAGMINHTFLGSQQFIPESNDHQKVDDAIPTTDISAKGIDIGAGLLYYSRRAYIGIASTHLFTSELHYNDHHSQKIERGYNLSAGYNIQTKQPLIEIHPAIFAQMSQRMIVGDILCRAIYNKMFNGGLGLRINDRGTSAATLYLGAEIGDICVGYAYEFPMSAISKVTIGGHELMATYRMKINKPKEKKNKHKSIRIL